MLFCCLDAESKRQHLEPCYASVLFTGEKTLSDYIQDIHMQGLNPCVTAWCDIHHRVAMIYTEHDFPAASAFYTHQLKIKELCD